MSFEQPSFSAEEVPEEYAIDIEDIDDVRYFIEESIERGASHCYGPAGI